MLSKKRLVVSYKSCPPAVLQAIKELYPMGYGDALIKVDKPNGDFFHAITVDFEDVSYLVKVDVKIDNLTDEEFEKQYGTNDVDEGSTDYSDKDQNHQNDASAHESGYE
jgi:hypothetical protein